MPDAIRPVTPPDECTCYPWDGIHAVDCKRGKSSMTPQFQEWNDAVNCATEFPAHDSPAGRWMSRVASAGHALAHDYIKVLERADREARLAVALRLKLEEIAGPEIASSVHV